MNSPFPILLLILFFAGTYSPLWRAWEQNQTAVGVIEDLSTTAGCAIDEARLQWDGDSKPITIEPYLQMVSASALNTDITPPLLATWKRDPRLYYWFMAQTAIKKEAYADSLTYLASADSGSMLNAAGHFATTETCRIINWAIASEVSYRKPPDGYAQHLMNHKKYEDVIEAFSRLLQYDQSHVGWRLSLAKAYVAKGETNIAQRVLAPILLKGTIEEIKEANELLKSNP